MKRLSEWALSPIRCILTRGRPRGIHRNTQKNRRQEEDRGKTWDTDTIAKEHQQPPETGKGKEQVGFSPEALRDCGPANSDSDVGPAILVLDF